MLKLETRGWMCKLEANYSVKLMREPGIELMSYPGVDINPKEVIEFTLDYTFTNAGQKHLYAVVDFLMMKT